MSLLGKVDFHGLAYAHDQVYGWDSTNGRFMVSADRQNWDERSTVALFGFAVDPNDAYHITTPRSPSGYRLYTPDLIERLRFIRGAKHLGLRLQDIAQLLEVMDRGQCPCGHTEALLRGRLTEIDEEIAGLARLRDELARLLDTHPAATWPGADPAACWCRNEFTERR